MSEITRFIVFVGAPCNCTPLIKGVWVVRDCTSDFTGTSLLHSFFQGGPGSVRLRFGDRTVRAVPVFGPGGSSKEGVFAVFLYSFTERTAFGSCKTLSFFSLVFLKSLVLIL